MRLVSLFAILSFSASSYAIIPVFDGASIAQTITMIANQAEQIQNQVNQYKMQAQHYQDIFSNAKTNIESLKDFHWDKANLVINNLLESTNTISQYKQEAGSLQNYLERFQSTEYYKKGKCFMGGCTKEELKQVEQSQIQSSVAEKRANDAMLKGIDKQQDSMKEDAQALIKLQKSAHDAEGQKQALQAASQLASNQSHQLLQIRGLLLAQQNSQATRYAAQANKEAIKEAGDERFKKGSFKKSAHMEW